MPKTEKLQNSEIAAYVVGCLGGDCRPIHIEHITARCFELNRAAFCWMLPEYADRPNIDRVRSVLRQSNRQGILVDSKNRFWQLTSAGATWFSMNRDKIAKALSDGGPQRIGLDDDKSSPVPRGRRGPTDFILATEHDKQVDILQQILALDPQAVQSPERSPLRMYVETSLDADSLRHIPCVLGVDLLNGPQKTRRTRRHCRKAKKEASKPNREPKKDKQNAVQAAEANTAEVKSN